MRMLYALFSNVLLLVFFEFSAIIVFPGNSITIANKKNHKQYVFSIAIISNGDAV